MKVLVFIDHDIICRHFVMNGALKDLCAAADVLFVFPDDGGRRVKLDPESLDLGAPFVRVPIDAYRQQAWRWMLYADQLKFRPGQHEAAIRRIRRDVLGWKSALLLTLGGLPLGASILKAIVDKRFRERPAKELEALIGAEKPDVVLHPSVLDGVFINDLVGSCASRGIPLVVAMNSWDNPSTKRAVVGQPDRLLVWGPQTREHAMRFIGLSGEKAIAFGAAQFDVFAQAPRITREAFCIAHGLDPARPVLLFAGSNARIDEFETLKAIDEAIETGALPPLSIVYRPHPWGGGGAGGTRFGAAAFRHIAIDRTMRAYLERVAAGDTAMSLPDYRDTHDLLSAVDAVISPVSTILVEGALHGKPVVAYLPADDAGPLKDMIPLLHFEEFFALPDVKVARSRDSLFAEMAKLADGSEREGRGSRLKAQMDRFLTPFERPWRVRIVDFLRDLTQDKDKDHAA